MNIIKKIFLLLFILGTAAAEENQNKSQAHPFSEMAASGNDWLISKGNEQRLLKPITWVSSQAVSLILFPLCITADLALITAKQAKTAPQSLLARDPVKKQGYLEEYRKNNQALKSASLGLVTAPLAILSPDLITHHFVPEKIQTYEVTPYGKLYTAKAHIAHPKSIADVQAIIHEAKNAGKSVSTMGKSMSQGKQAISNEDWNIIINTDGLNDISIDPVLKIAIVGPGASWNDIQREANPHGLAVRVMQASNIFSIGGSISVNCHGWDHKTGSLTHTLIDLTIVDANGSIVKLMPKDRLFHAVVGGYGGFGVIVEATLSLTDNVEMEETGIEVPPSQYVAYFDQHIKNNDQIDMHLYRLSLQPKKLFETGIAVNYKKVGEPPVASFLSEEPKKGTRLDRIKLHTIRRLSWFRDIAWKKEKSSALTEKFLTRNEVMRPPINPIFNASRVDTEWLQEYFVKGEDLADFLKFLAGVLQKNDVAMFNASVRFVKKDDKTLLSYAPKEDRFAIVLFFNQKLTSKEVEKTKRWVQEVIDYLIAHDGTFYLPYHHFATLEQFKACYPNWEVVNAYKKAIDPSGIFNNGLYADYFVEEKDSFFREVFNRVTGYREEMGDFLHNIFMQLDEEKFFIVMDTILEDKKVSDEEIYNKLFSAISEASPGTLSKLKLSLRSLSCLKEELGDQTAELVGDKQVCNYAEIGYPGRMTRPLKKRLQISGKCYVIHDEERLTDYVEAGFPLPYDQFVSLNDYSPISSDEIPSESLDLVCMYIGLHHIPHEKLDPFIDSIKRVLKPGGSFILMDHDADSIAMIHFVDVVHSVFNAATGVSPFTNSQEVRNFHSLSYWKDKLEAHGLILFSHPPLIRAGDSTKNSLIRFDKPLPPFAENTSFDPELLRPLSQTYLTAAEWQNVRAAQRYAEFVKTNPACDFPYFREIGGFWDVYGNSWKAASQEGSFSDIAFSDYNLMNLFVGVSMTCEYGIKGILNTPFSIGNQLTGGFLSSSKDSPTDQERIRSLQAYGEFIENTPFYEYPYFQEIKSYWNSYTQNKTLKSRIKGVAVGAGMTIENTIKGIVSLPLSWIYGSESLGDSKTMQLLVRDDDEEFQKLKDPDIKLIVAHENLKLLEVPRYMRFTELILDMARHSLIQCHQIAGQSKIQIDVKHKASSLLLSAGVTKLYDIPAPTDKEHQYIALEVEVQSLCDSIRALEKEGAEILFIHDY